MLGCLDILFKCYFLYFRFYENKEKTSVGRRFRRATSKECTKRSIKLDKLILSAYYLFGEFQVYSIVHLSIFRCVCKYILTNLAVYVYIQSIHHILYYTRSRDGYSERKYHFVNDVVFR